MDVDRTIAGIAAAQHGVLSRRQLLEAGASAHQVNHRVGKGVLVRVHGGVYRVAASPVTWHQRIMAAVLAGGPGAVASHRAAGFLHGFDGIDPRPEVSVGRERAPQPPGVLVHRISGIAPSDVEVRGGIPRTRPPATLLGLAAVVPAGRLERALDDALLRGLVSCAQLARRLDAAGGQGRPGAAGLGRLLAARMDHPRWLPSELERRLFALLRAAGLPLPVPQFEVVLPGGRRVYLDFAWPEVLVALEADSYRYHAGRLDWSRDRTRNSLLTAIGWRILPVTWEDVVHTPDELLATLKLAGPP